MNRSGQSACWNRRIYVGFDRKAHKINYSKHPRCVASNRFPPTNSVCHLIKHCMLGIYFIQLLYYTTSVYTSNRLILLFWQGKKIINKTPLTAHVFAVWSVLHSLCVRSTSNTRWARTHSNRRSILHACIMFVYIFSIFHVLLIEWGWDANITFDKRMHRRQIYHSGI